MSPHRPGADHRRGVERAGVERAGSSRAEGPGVHRHFAEELRQQPQQHQLEGTGGLGRVLNTGGASGLGAAVADEHGGEPVVFDRVAPEGPHEVVVIDLADAGRTQHAVAHVAEQGIASTLGLRALPEATAYSASEFAVVGMTRALGAELGGEVRVTCPIPAGMSTASFDGRPAKDRPGTDALLMDPADVAASVVGVLSVRGTGTIRELVITAPGEPSWP